jgi:hypothetical protein
MALILDRKIRQFNLSFTVLIMALRSERAGHSDV